MKIIMFTFVFIKYNLYFIDQIGANTAQCSVSKDIFITV